MTIAIATPTATAILPRCALCGELSASTITSAGYLGAPVGSRICRDWRACGVKAVATP